MRSFFSEAGVDLVIVRENTEDLYAGVEFEAGKAETSRLIEFINALPADRKIKTNGRRDRDLDQADQCLGNRTHRAVRL